MPQLAPGEPVPPGLEDVIKCVAQIQSTLDEYKKSPLIGLEYLVEMTPDESDKEPHYLCTLCDKKGDPRVAMAHITSFNHRSKYISVHFPTAHNMFNTEYSKNKEQKNKLLPHLAMNHLCSKIEEQYGRLQPVVLDREYFENNRLEVEQKIRNDKHFRERADADFVECLSKETIESLIRLDETSVTDDRLPSAEHQKSTFVKKNVICSQNKDSVEGQEEDISRKLPELGKTDKTSEKGAKVQKMEDEGPGKKSLSPVSTISISSSYRSRSKSRSRSRNGRRRYDRYRYRSNPRHYHRTRSRSCSSSRSRTRKSRSRSTDSKGRRWHQRSRSPRYRQRSPYRKERDKRNEGGNRSIRNEKDMWNRFRQEAHKIDLEMLKQLEFHEKYPEKHPQYSNEWKKFWNRRYIELQTENKDPNKHDYKPEWIEFWKKRVKDLSKQEMKTKIEDLKAKLGLPIEQPQQFESCSKRNQCSTVANNVITISSSEDNDRLDQEVNVSDIKDSDKPSASPRKHQEHSRDLSDQNRPGNSNWKHGQGRSGNVHSYINDNTNVVLVLKLLTALENQLGSLGARINTLLSKALVLERSASGSSESLLEDSENVILFETVREKLKGQLLLGVVSRTAVSATRKCIHKLTDILCSLKRVVHQARIAPPMSQDNRLNNEPNTLPCVMTEFNSAVPGIGIVDKVQIAQQIATTLIAQGKGDMSQDELQRIISAVVGAPVNKQEPTPKQQEKLDDQNCGQLPRSNVPNKTAESALQVLLSAITSKSSETSQSVQSKVSGLQLLQLAYNETFPTSITSKTKPRVSDLLQYISRLENEGGLPEKELKTLLQDFKELSPEDQQSLVTCIKNIEERNPDRVERISVNVQQHDSKTTSNTTESCTHSSPNSADSGRLSPFSLRMGGINPSCEKIGESHVSTTKTTIKKRERIDDSDDDYSFSELYAAASVKVRERGKAKEKEQMTKTQANSTNQKAQDHESVLRETKQIIANLMGQLPGKCTQKQDLRKYNQIHSNVNVIPELGTEISPRGRSGQPIPILDSSARQYSQTAFSNQYNCQASYPHKSDSYQLSMVGYPNSTNYNEGQQSHYSQPIPTPYTNQFNQQQFPQTGGEYYNQPSGYY